MDSISFVIIRHRKENLRKCSLRGLEGRPDIVFFTYPECVQQNVLPPLHGFFLLDIDGEELTPHDSAPCVLIDATWRYAAVMLRQLPQLATCQRRRLPNGWKTAYPRCQTACADPERGLASIEALYAASIIMGQHCEGLLDGYYWKDQFLEKNRPLVPSLVSQAAGPAKFCA